MVTPDFLTPGDKIGLIAPARFITAEQLQPVLKLIESWNLVPVLAPNILQPHHQFAGPDPVRAQGMQQLLDDPEIKALWSVRGGYGSIRLLEHLDFSKFKRNPKWLLGYSDVTVFHNVLQNLGIASIHATMPIDLAELPTALGNHQNALEALKQILFGSTPELEFATTASNRSGSGRAALTGGNLSMLYSMCGSPYQVPTSGKILVIEDLDEYLYHIDRMLRNLKNNGLLADLSGLIVGGFTKIHDNSIPFGNTVKEIILDLVKPYDYPVAFDAPTGHIHNNYPLIFGRQANFEVTPRAVSLKYL
ncbi:LD-carboxypeptidase [Gilvibacter sp. SZ-19]|uniref:S66 peptidase family protein n=1 Tax=Gilvibacter sp. SZ-19 TaxID=754429 RepID=UPI000B3D282A|nr:LD-carboxypeptidase [Gilvibacter sp. SZ-19]ARV11689.1 LD-carboxypeptidase [Gilvibacter sp. SZ-19]